MTQVRTFLAGCFALVLVSVVGAAGPSTQPSGAERENAELRQRVAALEAQVKSLEDQVTRLKRREGGYIVPPTPRTPSIPEAPRMPYRYDRAVPAPQQPGRDWIPRQYDGRAFYIVPCTPTENTAPATR
jgi:hypothetical protein